jgi:Flp pilus assembly pilin Flp
VTRAHHLKLSTVVRLARGQAMVEYTVILAFGLMVLLGPGGDVLRDLADVMKNNYRGYTYALSMSPLPDFDTGPQLREYIEGLNLDPELDEQSLERLTVDPVQDAVTAALSPLTNLTSQFSSIDGVLGALPDIQDIITEMAGDAISPF